MRRFVILVEDRSIVIFLSCEAALGSVEAHNLLEQIDCDTIVSHKRHRIVYQMFI